MNRSAGQDKEEVGQHPTYNTGPIDVDIVLVEEEARPAPMHRSHHIEGIEEQIIEEGQQTAHDTEPKDD